MIVRDMLIALCLWFLISSIFEIAFSFKEKNAFMKYLKGNSKHQVVILKITVLILSIYILLRYNILLYNYNNLLSQRIFSSPLVLKLMITIFIIIISKSIIFVISSFNEYQKKAFKDKANTILNNYIKVFVLLIIIVNIILILSVWLNEKPVVILTGISTVSVIFTIVFKDLIWGIVASIVSASNHLVRIGDSIKLERYNIEGVIVDISTTSVKMVTLDNKTISFPTHMLINDVVKNSYNNEEIINIQLRFSVYVTHSNIFIETVKSIFNKDKHIDSYNISIDDICSSNNCSILINVNTKGLTPNQSNEYKTWLCGEIGYKNYDIFNQQFKRYQ